MKRQHHHPNTPSNLNTHTHNYARRYTSKEVQTKLNLNSLKWVFICILVAWGSYQIGYVMGFSTPPTAHANMSISH